VNHISFSADAPGSYEGQCFEFCGLSHANMRTRVEALGASEFSAWAEGQKQDATTPPAGSAAAQGMDLFLKGACIQCHTIEGPMSAGGTPAAGGLGGPNLTHFASRDCFAGCIYENRDTEQLAAWLRSPPAEKPGSFMPDYDLTEPQIDALVAYLEQLK
jgi:cytochrome c oxidase subunit 2